jgi:ferredoxin-NADP reductase
MALDEAGKPIQLFIASGTGWATIKALLHDLPRVRSSATAHLTYIGTPYDADWIALPKRLPWLIRSPAASADQVDITAVDADPQLVEAYLSGPAIVTEAVAKRLVAAGVDAASIRSTCWPGA